MQSVNVQIRLLPILSLSILCSWEDDAVTSDWLLERGDGRADGASRTRGNVLRLRGVSRGGAAWVGTVGSTGVATMREGGGYFHIMVASSSENLLLFVKCRGLGEGNSIYC